MLPTARFVRPAFSPTSAPGPKSFLCGRADASRWGDVKFGVSGAVSKVHLTFCPPPQHLDRHLNGGSAELLRSEDVHHACRPFLPCLPALYAGCVCPTSCSTPPFLLKPEPSLLEAERKMVQRSSGASTINFDGRGKRLPHFKLRWCPPGMSQPTLHLRMEAKDGVLPHVVDCLP